MKVFSRAVETEAAKQNVGVKLKGAQIERTKGPFIVRGECSLTTYFNYDFSGLDETHFSVSLTQYSPFANFHAYIPRDSDDGRKLAALLGNGQERDMTLECEFGKEVGVARLIRVVSFD